MNKKAIVLVLCSMLCIPALTGCESSTETDFSLFNVEIKSDKSEEALEKFLDGYFTVTIDGQDYKVNTKEAVEYFTELNIQWEAEKINENEYYVIAKCENGEYIKFVIQMDTSDIYLDEICYDNGNQVIRGESAVDAFSQFLVEYVTITQDITLDYVCAYCGKEMKQSFVDGEWEDDFCSQECQDKWYKEQKQEVEKQQKQNLSTCKWCGKQYDPKNSNAWENEKFCSKECHVKYEEKQEAKTQKTCKWCNRNKLPSGAGDNDKCSECQAESWNWHCNDCNKSMSLSEYNSTGRETGFCPSCYEKYKQATQHTETDHKTYYCDRCGADITFKNFVQNIGGYDFLCEKCCMELGY